MSNHSPHEQTKLSVLQKQGKASPASSGTASHKARPRRSEQEGEVPFVFSSDSTRSSQVHSIAEELRLSNRGSGSSATLSAFDELALKVDRELRVSVSSKKSSFQGDDFTLNKLDLSDLDLYGRARELSVLQSAFETLFKREDKDLQKIGTRRLSSTRIMVSISGSSGSGKSRLAQELRSTVISRKGFFCTGKFDLQQRTAPYTAIAAAFTDLYQQILAKSEDFITTVREKTTEAVGEDTQVITDIVPALKKLFGTHEAQGAALAQGNIDTRANRLHSIFRKFTRALCSDGRTLVMVLDDLHNADLPSLELLDALVTDIDNPFFLLISTCRDNDVDATHPFVKKLEHFEEQGIDIRRITVGNLGPAAVNSIVATALRSSDEATKSLADIIHEKTAGNAFFVIQFLKSLVDNELLAYHFSILEWVWDDKEIENLVVTDNVADLLTEKLQKLRRESQVTVQVAACLGQRFEEETLAAMMEKVRFSVFDDIPSSYDAIIATRRLVEGGLLREDASGYAFVHDQIQNAALGLIPDDKNRLLHLRMGEKLLERLVVSEADRTIFLALDLCNPFVSSLEMEERLRLAKYNLKAGEMALKESAFAPAGRYMEAGLSCLGESAESEEHYALSVKLSTGAAEAAYCCGDFETMEYHMERVMNGDGPFDDKVRICLTRISSYCAEERFEEAVDTGIFALEKMGIARLPKSPSMLTVLRELIKTKVFLRKYTLDYLSNLKETVDEKRITAMGIIHMMIDAAAFTRPNLFAIMFLKQVRWSVKYGICKYSPTAFALYGTSMCQVLGDVDRGAMYGEVALALSDRLRAKETLSTTIIVVYGYVHHWCNDLRSCFKPFLYGYQTGIETGEVHHAYANLTFHDMALWLGSSRPLDELAELVERHRCVMNEYSQDAQACYNGIFLQTIYNLMGRCDNPMILTGEAMDEEMVLKLAADKQFYLVLVFMDSCRMQLAYLFDDYVLAGKYALSSLDYCTKLLTGCFDTARHFFFRGLTYLALARNGHQPRQNLRSALKMMKTMKKWNAGGNPNVRHQVLLLDAELTWLKGRNDAASEKYKNAILAANSFGSLQDKALAHERAGRFHFDADKDSYWAVHHLDAAIQCYNDWGAHAKVEQLTQKYGKIIGESKHASRESKRLSIIAVQRFNEK